MKRVLYIVLALGLALVARVAWADVSVQGGPVGSSSNPIKTVTVTSDTSSAGDFSAGKTIVGFKIIATSASAVCGLYDASSLGGASTTTMIDELREATAHETGVQLWPAPYVLGTDLNIGATNAICIVYYY